MPRVHMIQKARASKKSRRCTGCGKDIEPGQSFYTWKRRFGRSGMHYFKHTACGRPKPTELSSRKTAVIEEAIQSAENELSNWSFEADLDDGTVETVEIDYADVTAILEGVAGTARDVASEYQDSYDNLPENFQQGPSGEAMQDVAERLESWADELESFEPSNATVEIAGREDGQDEDEWLEAAESEVEEAAESIRSEAQDLLAEMPEYEG